MSARQTTTAGSGVRTGLGERHAGVSSAAGRPVRSAFSMAATSIGSRPTDEPVIVPGLLLQFEAEGLLHKLAHRLSAHLGGAIARVEERRAHRVGEQPVRGGDDVN